MNACKLFLSILLSCFSASSAMADIYEWTDVNGIKHYTNQAPAPGSGVLMKTEEEPYDESADRARMEAERQERQELARLELAQREAELELREVEVEQRLAEAARLTQGVMREGDDYLYEANSRNWVITVAGSSRCRDDRWDCKSSDYNRWYYRTGHIRPTHPDNFYHQKLNQKNHIIKKPYGSNRRIRLNRYRGQVRPQHTNPLRQIGHYQINKLNNRITNHYNIYRRPGAASRSGGFSGFGNFSRGRSGFRK